MWALNVGLTSADVQEFISYETARLQMENMSFVKLRDFYLAKDSCLPLLPSDMQLWYQAACYPAVCVPPFISHHVRARSRSVWFRYFFSRTVMALCWQGMAVTTSPFYLWLPQVLTEVACLKFLLILMPCRRSSEVFVPAC